MAWEVKWEDASYVSDDLTMEELESIEEMTGSSWSMLNPVRSIKDAKAMIVIAMIRQGTPKAAVEKRVQAITVGDLKDVFSWKAEDADPLEIIKETSKESRSGQRKGSGGSRRKSAKSA